jgi:hypothetical protein
VFREKRARHQILVARSWTDNLQHISTRTESREQRDARLEKVALNGNTNGTADVKTGVNAKTGDASNGPENGNGVEVKAEVASPNGEGFRYDEYDGKA